MGKKPMREFSRVAALSVLFLAASTAVAGDWEHRLTPYLWMSAMDGSQTIGTPSGPLTADLDLSFSDIWDNLELGGMLRYRGQNERWVVMADSIYMDLEAKGGRQGALIDVDAKIKAKQLALEADLGYEVADRIVVYAGLRYNDLEQDIAVTTTGGPAAGTRTASAGDSWIDPVVGVATESPIGKRWSVGLLGDIGGFGIGSDFAWQLLGSVRYQASERISVVGVYRYIDMDYENGTGTELFGYDMALSGPALGVSFDF
jgi:opacity protein-like surface antigen